jgi:hypothetical protein
VDNAVLTMRRQCGLHMHTAKSNMDNAVLIVCGTDTDNAVPSICMLQSNADNAVLTCMLQRVMWTVRSQSYAERDADNAVLSISMLQCNADNAVSYACCKEQCGPCGLWNTTRTMQSSAYACCKVTRTMQSSYACCKA